MARSKDSKKSSLSLVRSNPVPTGLDADESQLMDEMFKYWYERRVGSCGHTTKSVNRDLGTLRQFVEFSHKPAWRWTERVFEEWCYHIGVERKLAQRTQQVYQGAVKKFLIYVIENPYFIGKVQQNFGTSIKQVVTPENSIPHKTDDAPKKPRRSMSRKQIEVLFESVDVAIREARRWGAKGFRPLQRDKAMYFLMYVTGIRNAEARGIDINSFLPNDDFPEFGDYGRVTVVGKGSKGSGPKQRTIVIDHPLLPPTLKWYIDEVRPHFLRRANPNEDAFFLSQHGRRLSSTSINERFRVLLKHANQETFSFTPHSLRRTALTHGRQLTTVEVQQRKAGHVYPCTTEGYTDLGDDFIRGQVNASIEAQIRASTKEDEDG